MNKLLIIVVLLSACGTSSDGTGGEDGLSGPQGPAGEDGADGEDGTPGQDGADGEDGADGQPGEQGDTGMTGPQGPAGPAGPAGTVDKGARYIVESSVRLTAANTHFATVIACDDAADMMLSGSCEWQAGQVASATVFVLTYNRMEIPAADQADTYTCGGRATDVSSSGTPTGQTKLTVRAVCVAL